MNLNKSQLNTRKIVAIALYKFFHGINATHKGNKCNVKTSTIKT